MYLLRYGAVMRERYGEPSQSQVAEVAEVADATGWWK